MAGGRMAVAFETKDQEDEQSCFSDHSLKDLQSNFRGIKLVYAQVGELLKLTNPELATMIQEKIISTETALASIPLPYDQTILAAETDQAHSMMATAITELEELSLLFERGSKATGTPFSFRGEEN